MAVDQDVSRAPADWSACPPWHIRHGRIYSPPRYWIIMLEQITDLTRSLSEFLRQQDFFKKRSVGMVAGVILTSAQDRWAVSVARPPCFIDNIYRFTSHLWRAALVAWESVTDILFPSPFLQSDATCCHMAYPFSRSILGWRLEIDRRTVGDLDNEEWDRVK